MDTVSIAEIPASEWHRLDALNRAVFSETRLVNQVDHPGLLIVGAFAGGELIGFKVGYPKSRHEFYSAKGAVDPGWRRKGIARRMLHFMMARVYQTGFDHFSYHTFPNRHPAMLIMGLQEGFRVVDARFNTEFNDWQVELGKRLTFDV